MLEARPTIMTAVPRLYETLHSRITRNVKKQGGIKTKKSVGFGFEDITKLVKGDPKVKTEMNQI